MWKVKYGKGEEDPYSFSTNNFLGRQIFEFNPNAGTPEGRAQVEDARQNFYRNRGKVKPCSDLIWRLREIMGVYMRNCMLHYAAYRNIFPIWALAEYRNMVPLPSK